MLHTHAKSGTLREFTMNSASPPCLERQHRGLFLTVSFGGIISEAMLTESDILAALRDCYDPALPCNIVDLGLVRSVAVSPDPEAPGAGIPGVPQKHRIRVEFSLTNPTDEAEAQLGAQIRNRLAGIEQAGETTILFVREPAWSPQQITSAGRRTLGLDGNRNLVQIR